MGDQLADAHGVGRSLGGRRYRVGVEVSAGAGVEAALPLEQAARDRVMAAAERRAVSLDRFFM
ncbi:MAG: hypothetical protein ACLSAF_21575 [Intestinimonas sp.]